MVSSTMSHLSRIRPGLARAAVAWPQLTCVRDRSYTTTAVAMARVWRPDMNDVDRLSKGDGAKKRGTGNYNIPHRLNSDERPVYEAAKKKGYLPVRGTGYRKGRKGNPLPNIYRQWCDAKAQACIVIEQDLIGNGKDCVVVDLSPLRVTSIQPAVQVCHDLAEAAGARHVLPDERPLDAVPFNAITVELPQSVQHMLYPDTATPPNLPAVVPEQIAAAEQAVLQQADIVRQLKASGQDNSSPAVQQQVQVLLQLKAQLQQFLNAAAQSSGAVVALNEVLPAAECVNVSQQDSRDNNSNSPRAGNTSTAHCLCGSDFETASNSSSSSSGDSSSSRRREVLDEDHPFVNAAIWQIPVMPLFYEADRTLAKTLAKNISTALSAAAVAQR